MKQNWKKNLLKGFCLTSAAFVFQACYGTPQDFGYDLLIEGKVISKNTGLPVEGIKVSVANEIQYAFSDSAGNFSFYTELRDSIKLTFEDVDASANKNFVKRDTVLKVNNKCMNLNIELEEN